MVNLLAILLSMAMMLAGATGTPGEAIEPVSRVYTVSNITVNTGDRSLSLNPTAAFGVKTDGTQCAFDFHIDSNGERLLPFQLVADESGLLLLSDSSNTTLRLTAEQIEQSMGQAMQSVPGLSSGAIEGGDQVSALVMNEYLPAYARVLELVN